jgi:hypothetical protein
MKLSFALPPGFTILNSLFLGALLWIGAQLPAWFAWGFTVLTALVPDVSVASSPLAPPGQ